jgi:hypothetical protein
MLPRRLYFCKEGRRRVSSSPLSADFSKKFPQQQQPRGKKLRQQENFHKRPRSFSLSLSLATFHLLAAPEPEPFKNTAEL